ncbi:MAG: hydrogenase maturation protease [Sulfurovum sp.]|nr:hydrogenase maturation protease [Sulfurovum sp.]
MTVKNGDFLSTLLERFNTPDSLVYGIGNVGREDDGLGWAFVDWIEENDVCSEAELVRSYQLHLEDADLISHKKRVLFVDATKKEDIDSFNVSKIKAKMDVSFTSHAISVPSVLAICHQCFENVPEVYLLEIKGYAWELKIGLTPHANKNLEDVIANLDTITV